MLYISLINKQHSNKHVWIIKNLWKKKKNIIKLVKNECWITGMLRGYKNRALTVKQFEQLVAYIINVTAQLATSKWETHFKKFIVIKVGQWKGIGQL